MTEQSDEPVITRAGAGEGEQWFALMHRPGPALADGESIFAHAAFAEHVAFLNRLDERGLLVAAGPLTDEDGAGMTIIRVQPHHGVVDVASLAASDDRCVAAGFLTVTVRPWQVMFTVV
jgi:uncharacterized protein YciI